MENRPYSAGILGQAFLGDQVPPRSSRSWLMSLIVHTFAVVALFNVHFIASPVNVRLQRILLTLTAPPAEPAPGPPKLHPVEVVSVTPPTPKAFTAPVPPKPKAPEIAIETPPVIEPPKAPDVAPEIPHLPPPIKTGNLDEVAMAPAPVKRGTVEDAGFGGAEAARQNKARAAVGLGAFGSSNLTTATARGGSVATGGFGAAGIGGRAGARGKVQAGGFSEAAVPGTPTWPRGKVQSGGFSETAAPAPAPPPAPRAAVSNGGFGDVSVDSAPHAAAAPTVVTQTPAEILSKPRPAYTEEARNQRIEGEVLLEVLFSASGEASVVRMVRGLGHGLDENGAAAVRAIRFKPAQRNGVAIDSTAIVHIVFQLAG